MLAVLVGLKGSGKTTLMKKVKKLRPDIKHIVAGDYFAEYYKKKGLKRDEGDKNVESSEHFRIHKEVFKKLREEADKHDNVIVDTHCFLTKKEGFYPGLPWFALKELEPDTLIALEFRPEDILQRRKKDEKELGRKRSAASSIEGVKLEYEIQRNFLCAAAGMVGCTVKLLRRMEPESYDFEHLDKNSEELLELFD
ncbi:MAG: AAA family ATPase [Candidatus Aenigmarchaeota archaeon]|nr:AAA family ATPase [Candidatus Aenigmarchaeota archaeon]